MALASTAHLHAEESRDCVVPPLPASGILVALDVFCDGPAGPVENSNDLTNQLSDAVVRLLGDDSDSLLADHVVIGVVQRSICHPGNGPPGSWKMHKGGQVQGCKAHTPWLVLLARVGLATPLPHEQVTVHLVENPMTSEPASCRPSPFCARTVPACHSNPKRTAKAPEGL